MLVVLFSERLSVRSFGWHLFKRMRRDGEEFSSHCFAGDESFVPTDMEGVLLTLGQKNRQGFSSEVCDALQGNDQGHK